MPPSYGQSSGLHLANGNSTGTAYNYRDGNFSCDATGSPCAHDIAVVIIITFFCSIFGLIILLTVELGQGWGLQTHAAPQKPAAPWCWSHPWWKNKFNIILSLSHSFFQQENHPGDIKTTQRRFKITLNTMWIQKTGWGKPYLLHESISQPEFLFFSIPVMFVPLFIPDAESGSNLNSWPILSVSPPWRRWGGG